MTTPRPTTSLNPHEDLQIALAVGASCQGAIQHADTKAAVLLAAQTAAVTIVAATGHTGLSAGHPGPAIAAVVVLGTVFVVAAVTATCWLGRCLRPRLAGPDRPSRFALPDLAARLLPPDRSPVAEQRDDAWRTAAVLARIAMDKHHAVGASLPWVAATAAATLGWLALGTIGGY